MFQKGNNKNICKDKKFMYVITHSNVLWFVEGYGKEVML
jgi:hypothetical protein